jgi:hypothetical protein
MVVSLAGLLFVLFLSSKRSSGIPILYGFTIFFGWLTAMILGMTFKTLPFIIWNKVYSHVAGKNPAPKELFSEPLFRWMTLLYIPGYVLVLAGVGFGADWVLKAGCFGLLAAAMLYVCNVGLILWHKRSI